MFKDVLKRLRESKGISQEKLAYDLGVTPGTIGNYEQGQRLPKDDKMWIKIAKYFNVTVDYLMDVDNECSIIPLNNDCLNCENLYFLNAYHSNNPKEIKLLKTIQITRIPDNELDLLMGMIESWKFPKKY